MPAMSLITMIYQYKPSVSPLKNLWGLLVGFCRADKTPLTFIDPQLWPWWPSTAPTPKSQLIFFLSPVDSTCNWWGEKCYPSKSKICWRHSEDIEKLPVSLHLIWTQGILRGCKHKPQESQVHTWPSVREWFQAALWHLSPMAWFSKDSEMVKLHFLLHCKGLLSTCTRYFISINLCLWYIKGILWANSMCWSSLLASIFNCNVKDVFIIKK